jgi:hypothetical protein
MKRTFFKFLLTIVFAIVSTRSAQADALDHWTSTEVDTNGMAWCPSGYVLWSATYGNGRYVAVGEGIYNDVGTVETSEDGIHWTFRPCTNFIYGMLNVYDVVYGNGIFVTCGWDGYTGQNIYHSTNGINWTSHTTVINQFYGVAYGNTIGGPMFVAVGDGYLINGFTVATTNKNIYTSPDGITWTPRASTSSSADVHPLEDVAFGLSRFVAIDSTGYIYNSTLGTSWGTRSQVSGNTNISGFGYMNFCNDRFIAYLNTESNVISLNGTSWSSMVKDVTNVFTRVIYKNGLYLAPAGGQLFISTNATNWVSQTLSTSTNLSLVGLEFGASNAIVVGYEYRAGTDVREMRAFVSDSFLSVKSNPGLSPGLTVSGVRDWPYRIESTANLSGNWQTQAVFTLTNGSVTWTDTTVTNPPRFYRAVLP